jgi:hypothetical protein
MSEEYPFTFDVLTADPETLSTAFTVNVATSNG